jgi:hypothetical protein
MRHTTIELAKRNEPMMKTNIAMVLLTACGVLAFSAGCGKNEGAAPPAAKDTQTPVDAAAAQSQKAAEAQLKADAERAAQTAQAAEAQKQAEAAKVAEAAKAEATKQQAEAEKLAAEKAAAEKAAADKLAQTTAAAAQEKGRIQSLIDTAKNLTGQNKYAEALKVIGELANLKLTPEQQTLVDGLKKTAEQQAAQAVSEKAASGASKAIGDALGGKK